jgi:hypothetical protein
MTHLKHWQDPINAALGLWVLISPWAVGYQADTAALWNAVIVGLLLAGVALGAIFVPRAWEEWTAGVLGLWLIASPWALSFEANREAMLTAVWTGIAAVVLALWTLATDRTYGRSATRSTAS